MQKHEFLDALKHSRFQIHSSFGGHFEKAENLEAAPVLPVYQRTTEVTPPASAAVEKYSGCFGTPRDIVFRVHCLQVAQQISAKTRTIVQLNVFILIPSDHFQEVETQL